MPDRTRRWQEQNRRYQRSVNIGRLQNHRESPPIKNPPEITTVSFVTLVAGNDHDEERLNESP